MQQKGLSPMVATIILIGIVMVIAGVLAAGLSGGAPQAPKNARLSLDGVEDGATSFTITHAGGDPIIDAWWITNNSDDFKPGDVDIRIDGVSLDGGFTENVALLTEDGSTVYSGSTFSLSENADFKVGDMLKIENLNSSMSSGEEIKIIYLPQDQVLLTEEV